MEEKNTGSISDGYHTFDELYEHRIVLYMALCKGVENNGLDVWKSELHSDGSGYAGWFILGINKKKGEQITYHLPLNRWDECYFAESIPCAPDWDGHTPQDVLARIKKL